MLRASNRVLAYALLLGLGSACAPSQPASIQPEPVDGLVLYDSYGELLVAMLTAMRTGDGATAQSSIASAGQIETMCPGFTVAVTPYTPAGLGVASSHCQEVFAPIPDDVLQDSLNTHENGRMHEPMPDRIFEGNWRERCPADFEVFQIVGIFEVHGPGTPEAGLEVNDIFRHRGRWGLMSIPRCRGPGE